jgi:predicted DNA-binding WGR domain protein
VNERTFEFKDGTSNKFWAISVSGDSHTTRYGKIGSKGQSTTKTFPTPEKAQAEADKLIAEKTGKGYTETTAGGATAPAPIPAPVVAVPSPKKAARKKASATPELAEEPEPPAVPVPPTPPAAEVAQPPAAHHLDLAPEDYLWVTYPAEVPAYEPPAADLTPAKFLALLADGKELSTGDAWYWPRPNLTDTVRTHVIPRMTEAERREARALLAPHVGLGSVPTYNLHSLPPAFGFAAALGMHDEIEALVASWPDGYAAIKNEYAAFYRAPERMVFGLGSRAKVLYHGRRLKLTFLVPEQIRGWLAHTGDEALDVVRDAILAVGKKDEAEKVCRELARVRTPAAAPHMLALALDSKAAGVARAWLAEDPGRAADGLAKAAAGKGKVADAAKEFFAELKAKGQHDLIRATLAAHPEAAAALRAILDHEEKTYPDLDRAAMPADLKAAFDALPQKVSLPDFVSVATLPPILLGGAKLAGPDVAAMLTAFRAQKGEIRLPVAVALKAHADARSLDAFSWAMFQEWQKAGNPSKDKWCFLTCGWLGGDNTARQLTPLIREWPGQSQHQRAKTCCGSSGPTSP